MSRTGGGRTAVTSSSGKRRSAPRLTRERALRAAVELADQEGIARLSMRRLAARLGVEAMSLYHHVPNKDAILDGMVDLVFAEIALPAIGGDWKAEMRRRAVSAREALARHPWAVGLMDARTAPGPATLRHHDAVIGCLRSGGFSVALAAHAFSLLDGYIYGFVLQEEALPATTPEELEALAAELLGGIPEGEYPHLAEMVSDHVLRPGYSYADEFGYGLELILDGLEDRRAREAGGG